MKCELYLLPVYIVRNWNGMGMRARKFGLLEIDNDSFGKETFDSNSELIHCSLIGVLLFVSL